VQVLILPKYKKLKGAKKSAQKVKLATPGLETKPAAEKTETLSKSGVEKRATPDKKQLGAKRAAEPAVKGVGKETKRKKVEPPAEKQKAPKETAVSSEKPSTRTRGAKTGPSSTAGAGAAKKGQKRELEAGKTDTATDSGVAKKAKGAAGRPVSSRFRTTPSQGAGSGVKDTSEKKKDQGGVQAAEQAPPQEGVGGRRRSSMIPLASLIKTRGRREQEKGEPMELSFSQVPIASLRGNKNLGAAAKPAAGKKAGEKKGDIDGGEEKGDGKGEKESAVEAAGRKRKAESPAGEKNGDVGVDIEETATVGAQTEGKGTAKEGAGVGDRAADAEVVLEEADRSVPLEEGKGMKEQEGGKEAKEQGRRKTRGKETGEEVVLVDEEPSRKTTDRRGRPSKRGAKNEDTGTMGKESPEVQAATESTKKATSRQENEAKGKDPLDEKPEEEKVPVSTRGKGKRSMGKQAGAAHQGRPGKKEKGLEQEKRQEDEEHGKEGGVGGSGDAEEQRPSKRTRRGGLEITEGTVEAVQLEAPSKAAPRRGGRKSALPKAQKSAAPEKAEKAVTEKEVEEERSPDAEPALEIAEEKSGPLRRGGRRSGEEGGGRGLSRKLSVRVSGGVSDDMEGLGSPTLRKRREMGEVKVFFSNRVVDQVKEAQKKVGCRF
jgi:hypothetical protein